MLGLTGLALSLAALPFVAQVACIVLLADVTQYVVTTPRGHTGTTHSGPWTRTSPCTCRCSIGSSARSACPGDQWPDDYGIHGDPVPEGYARQLAYPFRGRDAD